MTFGNIRGGTWILFSFFALACNAQPLEEKPEQSLQNYVEQVYGTDQNLVNGAKYFDLNVRASGHKFLGDDFFYKGRILLDNKEYSDVMIKYDIYNQKIILKHEFPDGSTHEIIINSLRIKEFEIEGRTFQKEFFPGSGPWFLNLVADGDLQCYAHFRKVLIPLVSGKKSVYQFSDTKIRYYLRWQDEMHQFNNVLAFLRVFPGHRKVLLSYIIRNKLIIRYAGDEDMRKLILYCGQIVQNSTGK